MYMTTHSIWRENKLTGHKEFFVQIDHRNFSNVREIVHALNETRFSIFENSDILYYIKEDRDCFESPQFREMENKLLNHTLNENIKTNISNSFSE
jgi:hypothetical protein